MGIQEIRYWSEFDAADGCSTDILETLGFMSFSTRSPRHPMRVDEVAVVLNQLYEPSP